MVTNTQSAPTREDIALAEVGHTDVSRATVWFLVAFFLSRSRRSPQSRW